MKQAIENIEEMFRESLEPANSTPNRAANSRRSTPAITAVPDILERAITLLAGLLEAPDTTRPVLNALERQMQAMMARRTNDNLVQNSLRAEMGDIAPARKQRQALDLGATWSELSEARRCFICP